MMTGWTTYGGNYYYLGSDGAIVTGQTIEIDGVSYTFDSNGKCINK